MKKFEHLLVKKVFLCDAKWQIFRKKRYFAGSDSLKGLEMSYFSKYRLPEAYFIYMASMLLGLEMVYAQYDYPTVHDL